MIRTGERFGAAHVVAVLRGSRSKRVLELRHDRLSVHGIARGVDADELNDVIDQLIDKRLMARSMGEYPTIFVTASGRAALKDRETVDLTRTATSEPPTETAGAFDAALFDKLRSLRKKLADEQNMPAFVIFGDAALRRMADSLMPRDHESFRRIKGVGDAKLQQFGGQFIAVIADHAGKNAAAPSNDQFWAISAI